jgi:hypothetical protein
VTTNNSRAPGAVNRVRPRSNDGKGARADRPRDRFSLPVQTLKLSSIATSAFEQVSTIASATSIGALIMSFKK